MSPARPDLRENSVAASHPVRSSPHVPSGPVRFAPGAAGGAEALLDAEGPILRMIGRGEPIGAVLEAICRMIEALCPRSACSILLVETGAAALRWAAGSGLPAAYREAIGLMPIGPSCGACGTAVHRGESVIIADVATDPLAEPWAAMTLEFGLKACWSMPIRSAGGEILGAFGTYCLEARPPSAWERRVSERSAYLAGIALSRSKAEDEIRAAEERFRQLVDTMLQIAWVAGPDGSLEYLNNRWERHTGLRAVPSVDPEPFRGAIHPEDVERLAGPFRRSIAEGAAFEAEFRLRGRDGGYRWFLGRSAPVLDGEGRVVRRFGTATDIDDHKRAEEELIRANERLEVAQEIGRIGTFDWDLVGGGVEWSASQEALFGLAPGTFGGRYEDFLGFVDPEDRAGLEREVRRVFAERDDLRAEFRIIRRDGSTRWLSALGRMTFDEAGGPIRVVGVNQDITGRKRLEELLRQRAADLLALQGETAEALGLLDALFRGSPVGLAYLDRDLRYRRINPALAQAAGISPEAHVGRSIAEVLPELPAEVGLSLRRVVETGEPALEHETSLTIGDPPRDRIALCSYFPVKAGGRVIGAGVASFDITARKAAEQGLRESEEQFRAVYDQAALGIAEVDLSGRFTRANERYCQLVGYPLEDLVKLRFREITHPDDPPGNFRLFDRLARDHDRYTIEKRYLRRDGGTVWARTVVSLIRDGEGRPSRVLAMIEDIGDRKRLEAELARRMDDLADADRRKDDFLATLAHELRNPLAPIRNALHLMAHAHAEGGGGASALEAERAMAERQVTHLARLVDDLMDVARISKGKIELRKRPVELASIVEHAVGAARGALAARRQLLTVYLPAEPIRLEADPTRLEQVLDNLLTNAIKYSEPGGRIGLSAAPEGGEVVISVLDDGIGIDPAMLGRVFDMFVQAERRSDRSQGGLGIGLGLARTLVELHGGRVEARSAGLGLGSEFLVRLPIAPAPAPADAGSDPEPVAPAPARPAGRGRRRVLVVDDNVDAAVSLSRVLARVFRQEVRVAHDGPSALAEAEGFRPEVVLLDIGMPGMDGYEVARRLRESPWSSGALLVALTGWGQESDRKRSKDAGFDRHLVKPIEPDELGPLLEAAP